jgi:CubicO group peptidase (beta-lactamase class C family)
MLDLLVERVSGQRVAEFVSDRVWSKLGAEGDAIVALNLDGRAGMYGMFSSRLRDLARYGMLYTPSWDVVATERVVPQSLLDRIRDGCRPEIFESGVPLGMDPGGERPRCNSRHWDAIFPDGDFFKLGARGQGLYISPARDVVVAFFSTTTELGWESYARAIAKTLEPSE